MYKQQNKKLILFKLVNQDYIYFIIFNIRFFFCIDVDKIYLLLFLYVSVLQCQNILVNLVCYRILGYFCYFIIFIILFIIYLSIFCNSWFIVMVFYVFFQIFCGEQFKIYFIVCIFFMVIEFLSMQRYRDYEIVVQVGDSFVVFVVIFFQ